MFICLFFLTPNLVKYGSLRTLIIYYYETTFSLIVRVLKMENMEMVQDDTLESHTDTNNESSIEIKYVKWADKND